MPAGIPAPASATYSSTKSAMSSALCSPVLNTDTSTGRLAVEPRRLVGLGETVDHRGYLAQAEPGAVGAWSGSPGPHTRCPPLRLADGAQQDLAPLGADRAARQVE